MKTIDIQASIEAKREELIELVKKHGLNHHRVIACSQELDNLVYLFTCTEKESYIPEKKNTINTTRST
ncbi:Spo0E family sporulation regulatory protein-aspartic acid phosphatase [Bacillus rhizoplanae]|uniref:Spo0E family sporulation regulatory protein-aspartic acid phosphatase n=1 Tax=Bacillus rhizoplanae TaxID=2880966 RepID=UPI003D220D7E